MTRESLPDRYCCSPVDTGKASTLRVRAEFANPSKTLRPGMFGCIIADLGVRPDSILVPESAVLERQGKNFVRVIDADNRAVRRPVTVDRQISPGSGVGQPNPQADQDELASGKKAVK